jgi:hypothetical protein
MLVFRPDFIVQSTRENCCRSSLNRQRHRGVAVAKRKIRRTSVAASTRTPSPENDGKGTEGLKEFAAIADVQFFP